MTIANIPASAPLWKGASQEALSSIVECLSSASYHFADDSTCEWQHAHEALKTAAMHVNKLGLGATAIEYLYREKAQLIAFDQFLDAILKDARK